MISRIKANRKKRGHVSAGRGRIGKHRKHPGGRGKAGGQHHHLINYNKYHPGYFGKVGMRYYHKTQQKTYRPILNIDRLWNLFNVSLKSNSIQTNLAPVIDVTLHGYGKVLGKGNLPKQPFVIKTKSISKIAETKIKEAGGAVIIASN
jgi:large subunit ribosomal protein L27Ae